MSFVIGLSSGLLFGSMAQFSGRWLGAILAAFPVAAWFVFFGTVRAGGISDAEAELLGLSLLGVLLGITGAQVGGRLLRRTPQGDGSVTEGP